MLSCPSGSSGGPKLIHEAIRLRARERPDGVALVYQPDDPTTAGPSMTYAELDRITDRIAARLINLG